MRSLFRGAPIEGDLFEQSLGNFYYFFLGSSTYPFVDISIHKMNQFTVFFFCIVRDKCEGFIDLDTKVLKCNQLSTRHRHRRTHNLSVSLMEYYRSFVAFKFESFRFNAAPRLRHRYLEKTVKSQKSHERWYEQKKRWNESQLNECSICAEVNVTPADTTKSKHTRRTRRQFCFARIYQAAWRAFEKCRKDLKPMRIKGTYSDSSFC